MYHPRSQLPALETRQGSHRGAVCRCRVHGPSSRSPNSGGVRLRLVTRDPAPAAPSGTFKPGSRFQQRLQQQLNDGQSWHEPGLVKVTRTQRGNHSYRSLHRKVCHHRTAAPRAPGTFYKKATNAEADLLPPLSQPSLGFRWLERAARCSIHPLLAPSLTHRSSVKLLKSLLLFPHLSAS